MKRSIGVLASAVCAAALLTGGFGRPAAAEDKTYTVYLSNNFIGNDYRQQMERVAEVSVNKGPLAGRVDLRIENVENTVQAQINSLNNIIRARPDAILVDGGSAEALNPTIKKACDAGIVVVSSTVSGSLHLPSRAPPICSPQTKSRSVGPKRICWARLG